MVEPEREAVLYLGLLRRRWLLIVVVTLLGGLLATAAAYSMKPRYTAHTQVFFGVSNAESAINLNQGSVYTQQAVKSYALLATSPAILDPVIRDLGLHESADRLASRVQVEAPLDTVALQISASDESAARAAKIANGVTAQLAKTAAAMSPRTQSGKHMVTATVTSPAAVPAVPSGPRRKILIALGLVLGLVASVGYVVARDRLSDAVLDEHDLPVESPVLARITRFRRGKPNPSAAEAFRQLAVCVHPADSSGLDPTHRTLVTSAADGAGKSTTARNLAIAFADSGRRVLLIDANLRRPAVKEAADGNGGLRMSLEKGELVGVAPSRVDGLDILHAGRESVSASDIGRLLNPKRLGMLLDGVDGYDEVVLDGPPILTAAEALEISQVVASTVLVVRAGRTRSSDCQRAHDMLELIDVPIRGVVLCGVRSGGRQQRGMPARSPKGAPRFADGEPSSSGDMGKPRHATKLADEYESPDPAVDTLRG